MEIQNKLQSKMFGLSAVMNNKKLSDMIAEALDSTPGSTKRQKAAAVLKSLNKINKYNDGQGGAVLPDDPRLTVGQAPSPMGDITVGQAPSYAGDINVGPAADPTGEVSIIPSPPSTGPSAIMSPAPVKDKTQEAYEKGGIEGLGAYASTLGKPGAPVDGEEVTPIDLPTIPMPPEEEPEEVTDFYENWFQSLTPEQQKKWKPIYEAVKSGVGSSTFAFKMLADQEKLKRILPGVPEEMLPTGASLARQVDDLDDALRKEFQVDALRKNVTRLEEQGVNIEKDLADYITGRDEAIEKLDGLIDRTKKSMVDMDLANPFINKKMTNYLNYLYVMKGRQSKRYMDYLGDSIQQHEFRLLRATNSYNENLAAYEKQLASKTDITTEDYNNMKTMLEDMYDNLDAREEDLYDIDIKKNNLLQEELTTQKMVMEAAEGVFKKVGPTAVDEAKETFKEFIDEETGHIPLNEWIKVRDEWHSKYGPGAFDKNFPPEEWLDPEDPLAQKFFLTPLKMVTGLEGGESNAGTIDEMYGGGD